MKGKRYRLLKSHETNNGLTRINLTKCVHCKKQLKTKTDTKTLRIEQINYEKKKNKQKMKNSPFEIQKVFLSLSRHLYLLSNITMDHQENSIYFANTQASMKIKTKTENSE